MRRETLYRRGHQSDGEAKGTGDLKFILGHLYARFFLGPR
jgi:hypothetical protein